MGRHRLEPEPRPGAATRVLRLDVRRLAAVPLAVLVVGGLVSASDRPEPVGAHLAGGSDLEAVADLPAVPEQAVEVPASLTGADGKAPALELPPAVSADGSPTSPRVALDTAGIPSRALQAYRHAERLLGAADPACRLDWSLLAAIGKVESDHGRFAGNRLGEDGVARPGIIGVALDGGPGVAAIRDSDGGRWDRDTTWDRAVGPMQFIPGTWRLVASDAEPDGERNPQDVDDAAAAAGVYLCSGSGDLSRASDRYSAVRRYNNSDAYVRTVLALAAAYAGGATEVSASSVPAARTSPSAPSSSASATPAPAEDGSAPARPHPSQEPEPGAEATPEETTAPPSGSVGEVVGAVSDAVSSATRSAIPPAPSPTTSPTPPPSSEPELVRLLVATLPGSDELCVDADREPVDLVLGLCPAGAYLTPQP